MILGGCGAQDVPHGLEVQGGRGRGEGAGRLRLASCTHFHSRFHLSFSGSGAYTQGLSGQGSRIRICLWVHLPRIRPPRRYCVSTD